jgi:glycosyltransferase involved in cell wall biosynthesis
MRFLFLTQYFPPEIGGAQVQLGAIVRELLRRGHEVDVVTAMPNYPKGRVFDGYRGRFYSTEDWGGAAVHRVWLHAAVGGGLNRLANYGSFALSCLYGLARSRRPDWIYVESPSLLLGVPGRLAGLLWNRPFVFNVGDLWPDSIRELGALKSPAVLKALEALEAWSYREARFVNADTEGIYDTLVGRKGVPADKVLFFPIGVDVSLFRPASPDQALARELDLAGRKVLLYAGTLGFAQGLEVALQAMDRLKDSNPDLLLLLVGDGSTKAAIRRQAEAMRLPNVRFLDPRPEADIARLCTLSYAGFACLKDLPLFEGARPSKVFPYMAAGLPVVYSGSGELPRLLARADGGIAVHPGDPALLADALAGLVADPDRAAQMGRNGRAYALQHLDWSTIVGHWLDCLEGRALPTPPEA